jgi:hypothetical protein
MTSWEYPGKWMISLLKAYGFVLDAHHQVVKAFACTTCGSGILRHLLLTMSSLFKTKADDQ